jgi:hypothetical protein
MTPTSPSEVHYIYWKPEPKQRQWKPIPDTQAMRNLAIKDGAMFFTWAAMSKPFSGNGEPEPIRYGDFPLDFDSLDFAEAWEQVRTLCLIHLPEMFDIDPHAVSIYLSGGKGFHVTIPAQLFGSEAGDPMLPEIYKKIAADWKERFGLSTLDMSLYSMQKGKMFRIANVRRANGMYKVPLTVHELQTTKPEELQKLAERPREIEPVEVDIVINEDLTALFRSAKSAVYQELQRNELKPKSPSIDLPKDMPNCLRHILTEMPKTDNSSFNKLIMNLVDYYQGAEYSYNKAAASVHDFVTKYPHSTVYTTKEARKKHFTDQWNYRKDKPKYQFDCSYILGLKLRGSAFDCKRCPVNGEQKVREITTELGNEPLTFPSEVMSGVAGQFARLYGHHLEAPEHFFYMCFLTCLGSVLGKMLTLATEINPQSRFYTILLGESADDRKSTAIKKTVHFFKSTMENFDVCWGVGSAEGLQKRLKQSDSLLLCLDEFKQFVGKCRIEASVLLPCVNTLFESNDYESWTKKSEICLQDVHLSLLAASTVQTYERTWDSSFTDIGFNNRLFLVPGSGQKKHSFPRKVPDHKIQSLKTDITKVLQHAGYHQELDLTQDAKDHFQQWYLNLDRSIHAKRLDAYALRFMALLAVNELKTEVDMDTVKQALAICDWQLEVRQVHDPIDADNATAKMEEKIRRVLGRGPRTDRELKQYVHAKKAGLWVYGRAKKNLLNANEIQWNKRTKRYVSAEA